MPNETIVEVIRWTSKGDAEIIAQTKVMNREADETTKRYTTLLGLVNNPAFTKHAANLDRIRKSHELINQRLRNQSLAQRLADGSAVRQLRATERLSREYAGMQRRAELVARYGDRFGNLAYRFGGVGKAIGFAAGGIAGMGIGMARQGFEGTVEQARLAAEMKMISREMASAFKPLIDVFTRGAKAVRQRLEKTGEGGQNALMVGSVIGGTAAGAIALKGIAQTIGAVAGETTAARLRGYAMRGAVGAVGAGVLGYGVATGNVGAGAIGGAMAGFSIGGPVGAVVGAAGGALVSAAQNVPDARPGEKPSDYYARMRADGKTKFGAAWNTALEAPSAMWRGLTTGETGATGSRRSVQLAGGGHESMDDYFDRLTSAVEKREGERDPEEGGAALAAAMRELTEELRRGRAPDLPRPGGGA